MLLDQYTRVLDYNFGGLCSFFGNVLGLILKVWSLNPDLILSIKLFTDKTGVQK